MQTKPLWLPFIRQRKLSIAGIVLLGILTGYCTLLIPLSIGKYMEIVFNAGGGRSRALQLLGINLSNDLSYFFIFFIGLLLVKFISGWAEKYFSGFYGEKFVSHLRTQLFAQQLKKPPANISTQLPAYSNDQKMLQQLLVKGVIGFIKNGLFLLMALYVLFMLQPFLTAVVVALIPAYYFINRFFNNKAKPFFSKRRKMQGSLLSHVTHTLMNAANPIEPAAPEKTFSIKTGKLMEANKKYHLAKSFLSALIPFLLYSMLGILLALMAYGTPATGLSSSDAVTYILLLMMIFPSIRSIMRIENTRMQAGLSGNKFLKAFEEGEFEKKGKADKKEGANYKFFLPRN